MRASPAAGVGAGVAAKSSSLPVFDGDGEALPTAAPEFPAVG